MSLQATKKKAWSVSKSVSSKHVVNRSMDMPRSHDGKPGYKYKDKFLNDGEIMQLIYH